jgi:hypothetical protein
MKSLRNPSVACGLVFLMPVVVCVVAGCGGGDAGSSGSSGLSAVSKKQPTGSSTSELLSGGVSDAGYGNCGGESVSDGCA